MLNFTKKSISIFVILILIFNLLLPTITFAEGEIETVEAENQEKESKEITRNYEIKAEEEWDISENRDGSVIAKWNYKGKTLRILGNGKMKSLNGSSKYLKYNRLIEHVTIEKGITNIGQSAFSNCIKIKSISLPNSIKEIEIKAFSGCMNLERIEIPNSVLRIGTSVFEGCNNLKSIILEENNKNYLLDDGVLYTKDYKRLLVYPPAKEGEIYNIHEGVVNIEENAFNACINLKQITIPESAESIGIGCFYRLY